MPRVLQVGLDGERYIEKVCALDTAGAELLMRSRTYGIHKKGSGASVEIESQILDASGKLLYKIHSGSFLVLPPPPPVALS